MPAQESKAGSASKPSATSVDVLGADGIVPATDRVFGALDAAVAKGREWIASRD